MRDDGDVVAAAFLGRPLLRRAARRSRGAGCDDYDPQNQERDPWVSCSHRDLSVVRVITLRCRRRRAVRKTMPDDRQVVDVTFSPLEPLRAAGSTSITRSTAEHSRSSGRVGIVHPRERRLAGACCVPAVTTDQAFHTGPKKGLLQHAPIGFLEAIQIGPLVSPAPAASEGS